MGVSGQRQAPAALYPQEGTPVPFGYGLDGPQLVWTQNLEEKSYASAGDRTPVAWSSSL
jgi:hypothetical protein